MGRTGSAQRAEALQLLACLPAQQILDRVKHRARVRLDRDAIGRAQDVEIERGHERGDGSRRRLVPADLHAIAIGPHEVGMVDHPGAEPQHLLFEGAQRIQTGRLCCPGVPQADRRFGHDPPPTYIDDSASLHVRRMISSRIIKTSYYRSALDISQPLNKCRDHNTY